MNPATVVAAGSVVKTAAGASIEKGIWTLVIAVVTTLGLITVAIVKQWGPWKKGETEAREGDFARLRDDIQRQNDRIDKLEKQAADATAAANKANLHAMQSDAKLSSALTACELLLGLVEREMPGATEIALVKRLLTQAASNDMGVGEGFRNIATGKGNTQ